MFVKLGIDTEHNHFSEGYMTTEELELKTTVFPGN